MRFIDADLFMENVRKELNCDERCCECVHDNLCEIYKMTLKQPIAFDLEGVIKQFEEKRDYCYAEMKKQENKDIQEVEPLYLEQIHNRGMAYNNALEILKSALTATNGKNGG